MKQKIKDIANMANVSPATVSNALNGRKGVSEKTKIAVLKVAKEIGYSKDRLTYVTQKNIMLVVFKKHGYVVSETPFFASLIEGIEKECRALGYGMVISHINTNENNYMRLIDDLSSKYTTGILLLATEMSAEDIELFKKIDTPIVLVDGKFRENNFNSVLINNYDGAYRGTSYLIANGHENIGYLHSSIHINNFCERKCGYEKALEEHNMKVIDKFKILLEPTFEGAYRDMKIFLQNRTSALPTAFFADNDIIACGAMKALKEAGIEIPQEISIIGFDDMPICEIINPRLTTIKVFKQEMGSIAVRIIDSILYEERTIQQKIELSTELVTRDSVMRLKK